MRPTRVDAARWRSRCRATRSTRAASTASVSTWPRSRTSATSTSTTTAPWSTTSRRRRRSSSRRGPPPPSCASTTSGDARSLRDAACRPSPSLPTRPSSRTRSSDAPRSGGVPTAPRRASLAASTSPTRSSPLAAADVLGVDDEEASLALWEVPPVPGRLELVDGGPPSVLVDYAHSPDALERVLDDVRALRPASRLWVSVRLRRRARRGQAPDHGLDRLATRRRGRRHVGQPEGRVPECDHRGDRGGLRRRRGRDDRARPSERPSRSRSAVPRTTTSCCSPVRATRRPKRSPACTCPSTTASSRRRHSQRGPPRAEPHGGRRRRALPRDRVHPRADPLVASARHRPADPRGRPGDARREGRHAHDGRHPHRARGDLRLPGRPPRRVPDLHAERRPRAHARRRVRAHRPRRRPHRRPQHAQPRPQQADEVRRPGARRGRLRAGRVEVGGRDDDHLVHEVRPSRLARRAGGLDRVRRVRRRRHVQRRQPDRRARRTRRGVVDVLLRGAWP